MNSNQSLHLLTKLGLQEKYLKNEDATELISYVHKSSPQ